MSKRALKKYGDKMEATLKADPKALVQTTYRYIIVDPKAPDRG
jgi:hypothetical protein